MNEVFEIVEQQAVKEIVPENHVPFKAGPRTSRTSVRFNQVEFVKLREAARHEGVDVANFVRKRLFDVIGRDVFVCRICHRTCSDHFLHLTKNMVMVCEECRKTSLQIVLNSAYPEKILAVTNLCTPLPGQRQTNWDKGVVILTEQKRKASDSQSLPDPYQSLFRCHSMASALDEIRSLTAEGVRVLEVFQDGQPLKLDIAIQVSCQPVESSGSLLDE
jgi:hypothetical protein